MAVFVLGLVLLRQNRFAVDGGHAEKGGQPHPEDGARAAGEQRGGAAGDVAGADLSRDGGGDGLERGHALVVGLLTV